MPPLCAALVLVVAPVQFLPTALWQVAPANLAKFDGEIIGLRVTKPRAVVLVHGLLLHAVRGDHKAARPVMHDWMASKSDLVKELSAEADVFGFGYAQTVPVDAVAASDGMRTGVAKLKAAGYAEVVLVGHSAGGLVARQFAERYPNSGVTKVIQVAAPNAGSDFAALAIGLPKAHGSFVRSLGPKARAEPAGPLADGIEACCVVCKVPRLGGDTLVSLDSQWPIDLQRQGVPAVLVQASHFDAMKAPHAVLTIAQLVREKLARWTPDEVERGRVVMFGKHADAAAVKKADAKGTTTVGK